MKRALNGTAKVQLRDGAIKGINLGEIIAQGAQRARRGSQSAAARAERRRQDAEDRLQRAHRELRDQERRRAQRGPRRQGAALPARRRGRHQHRRLQPDYLAKASVVATGQGQGGARARPASPGSPCRCSSRGTFDDLKYQVDYRGMAGDAPKSEAGQKIKERLEEQLKDEKFKEKLKGLLGR